MAISQCTQNSKRQDSGRLFPIGGNGNQLKPTDNSTTFPSRKPDKDEADVMGIIVIVFIILVIMAVVITGIVCGYKAYKTPSNKARVDQWQRHGNDTYETTRGKSGGN